VHRDDDKPPRPPRKAYRRPTLTVYGDVRDLTRGYGIGKPDNGGTASHSMSHPNKS
jgi:hypothetical protein